MSATSTTDTAGEAPARPTAVTTNQVRQILMNELGISRVWLRAEVDRIVTDTVQKYVNDGAVDRLIERLVSTHLSSCYWPRTEGSRSRMRALIEEACAKQVTAAVKQRLAGLHLDLELHLPAESAEESAEAKDHD